MLYDKDRLIDIPMCSRMTDPDVPELHVHRRKRQCQCMTFCISNRSAAFAEHNAGPAPYCDGEAEQSEDEAVSSDEDMDDDDVAMSVEDVRQPAPQAHAVQRFLLICGDLLNRHVVVVGISHPCCGCASGPWRVPCSSVVAEQCVACRLQKW
jgi:hypothetical protein